MKYCVSTLSEPLENFTNVVVNPTMAIDQISNKIEDEEATDLVAEFLLEYYKQEDQDKILALLYKKVRIGGVLTLSVLNGRRAIYGLVENYFINANEILFGKVAMGEKQLKPVRSMCFDLNGFRAKLEETGFKIIQVLEDGLRNVIVCQKNQ